MTISNDNKVPVTWHSNPRVAEHWHVEDDGKNNVTCDLNPRHCLIKPGSFGFCGVRGNIDGKLYTFNYGKSVSATKEIIETEAVNHYSPGAEILSLGNIGCMMHCDFCQNWETSQVKYLDPSIVKSYTPREVIDLCHAHKIKILSWTYNDPVVWHEYILETSRLAMNEGIKTLYKSAFYIEKIPVDELIECIDIFSISLKSLDATFYRKITGARLEPVLDRIKQVYKSGKHLEISQLLITERNDKESDIKKTISWVLDELSPDVPLHFVAFHPAYRYMGMGRTPKSVLIHARNIALKAGIKHCYIGNVYDHEMADTKCEHCNSTLVQRYGLNSKVVGITPDNRCAYCGKITSILYPHEGSTEHLQPNSFTAFKKYVYLWNDEVNSVHIELPNDYNIDVWVRTSSVNGNSIQYNLLDKNIRRFVISKGNDNELSVMFEWNHPIDLTFLPVLDRAHYPVLPDIDTNLLGLADRKDKIAARKI